MKKKWKKKKKKKRNQGFHRKSLVLFLQEFWRRSQTLSSTYFEFWILRIINSKIVELCWNLLNRWMLQFQMKCGESILSKVMKLSVRILSIFFGNNFWKAALHIHRQSCYLIGKDHSVPEISIFLLIKTFHP